MRSDETGETRVQRILVAVDGSSPANDALSWSADIARRAGLDLAVARVFTPTQAELSPEIDRELHAQQRHELEHWCERVERVGQTTAVLLDGDPPDALLGAADDLDADLVVVGGRDRGPLSHTDPASVADQLAHTASRPLAIEPHAGAAPVAHLVVGIDASARSHPAVDFVADLAAGLAVGVTAVCAFEPFIELVPETDPHS
jgi:nucleotide-binding universal stress UspA family protein